MTVLYTKTYLHLWKYVAGFFLEWEMCHTKVVEKIKTHILYSITFSRKSYRMWDNVEEYGGARQAIEDNVSLFVDYDLWLWHSLLANVGCRVLHIILLLA
jgi:hypothetical protein